MDFKILTWSPPTVMQSKSLSSANCNADSMFLHRRVLPNTYCIALSYSYAYFSLFISDIASCLLENTKKTFSITSFNRLNTTGETNNNKWAQLLQYGLLHLNPVTAVDTVHINKNIMLPNIHWYSHKHTSVIFNQTAITVHKLCYFVL